MLSRGFDICCGLCYSVLNLLPVLSPYQAEQNAEKQYKDHPTMTEQTYGTVQYDRLCEQVARRIQDMILDGDLAKGSQLPPERELAEQFGVSRTVIREAMKVLGARGLINVIPGKGSFVTSLNTEAISLYMGLLVKARGASLLQFHEIRSALEIAAAGSATERATPEELIRLREMVGRIDECLASDAKEEFIAADVAFHTMLADASHNPLFQAVLDPIRNTLADIRRITYHIEDSPQRGQVFHRRILECIERVEAEGAREAMRQHMDFIAEDIETAQSETPSTSRQTA